MQSQKLKSVDQQTRKKKERSNSDLKKKGKRKRSRGERGEKKLKMNVSKVGNQTSSQDPQAVNSRSTFCVGRHENIHLTCGPYIARFQGFCWEPEHLPDSED